VSDGNQEREYQVGVFEARKRIIKLLTEQEYQAGVRDGVRDERKRILKKFHDIHDQHHTGKDFCWVCDAQYVIIEENK
jgi:hypothetical protein